MLICCVFPCAAEDACIHSHPPPSFFPPLFPSLQEPLKSNGCTQSTLCCAQGKSELYFLQNTNQRGKHWPCYRGLFTFNFCLFSFSSPFAVLSFFVPPVLSVFLLFMNFLSQFMSLSHSASAVYLLRVLYVRHQVVPNTDLTHPHTACYSCICSCLCDLNLSETHICTEWKHRHIHYTCSRAVLWCVVRLGQSFKLLIEV